MEHWTVLLLCLKHFFQGGDAKESVQWNASQSESSWIGFFFAPKTPTVWAGQKTAAPLGTMKRWERLFGLEKNGKTLNCVKLPCVIAGGFQFSSPFFLVLKQNKTWQDNAIVNLNYQVLPARKLSHISVACFFFARQEWEVIIWWEAFQLDDFFDTSFPHKIMGNNRITSNISIKNPPGFGFSLYILFLPLNKTKPCNKFPDIFFQHLLFNFQFQQKHMFFPTYNPSIFSICICLFAIPTSKIIKIVAQQKTLFPHIHRWCHPPSKFNMGIFRTPISKNSFGFFFRQTNQPTNQTTTKHQFSRFCSVSSWNPSWDNPRWLRSRIPLLILPFWPSQPILYWFNVSVGREWQRWNLESCTAMEFWTTSFCCFFFSSVFSLMEY